MIVFQIEDLSAHLHLAYLINVTIFAALIDLVEHPEGSKITITKNSTKNNSKKQTKKETPNLHTHPPQPWGTPKLQANYFWERASLSKILYIGT